MPDIIYRYRAVPKKYLKNIKKVLDIIVKYAIIVINNRKIILIIGVCLILLKKGLKATITMLFALNMLSSSIICSADETTTTVVATATKTSHTYVSNTTTDSTIENTVMTMTSIDGTSTTLDTTSESSDITTTLETSISTEPSTTETTPVETLGFKPNDNIEDINTQTIEKSINQDLLNSISYSEKLILIQNEVDDYLYNTTQLTPDEALKIVRKYISKVCSYTEISGSEVLQLCKYANDIVKEQNIRIEKNKQFYENINKILDNTNYSNYASTENYCKYIIKEGFKTQILSSKETLTLMQSIHKTVMSKLSKWELDLVNYQNYGFNSNQTLVTQWNTSYPDMQGWIYIADSTVDYPVMQYYDNNDYYLQHSWNGAESSRGTIELDYRSTLIGTKDSKNSTENVLIYGHNLSDNTMFSSLENYKKESYYKSHQLVEISTLEGQRLYKIYAVCSIFGLADGTKFKYWDDKYVSMDEELFNEHLKLTKENILYDIKDYPQFGQDILTLQTCDGSDGWRIVIFAKRVK